MTIHLIGRRSYLAGRLAAEMGATMPVAHVGREEFDPGRIRDGDWVVNCAFDPAHRAGAVGPDLGIDGALARAVAGTAARYVMVSTRAVYAPRAEPPLAEDEPPAPATVYGTNKAAIEAGLRALLGERLLVLRLANVFGAEPAGRRTFVSTALAALAARGEIELRMSPATRKDFLPARLFARAAAALIAGGAAGTVNIGSGIGLPVGELAGALVRGFGSGRVRVSDDAPGEEFVLDVTRLHALTGLSADRADLLADIEDAARRAR